MRVLLGVFVFAAVTGVGVAQDQPAIPQSPAVPETLALKISQVQLRAENLRLQERELQRQWADLQRLATAVEAEARQALEPPAETIFDWTQGRFVPKPAPPAATGPPKDPHP